MEHGVHSLPTLLWSCVKATAVRAYQDLSLTPASPSRFRFTPAPRNLTCCHDLPLTFSPKTKASTRSEKVVEITRDESGKRRQIWDGFIDLRRG